jgi:Coenzyme PQQ synthesis protein D (PqqD)
MAIAEDAKLSCPPQVLSRVLDGEAVLLHLGSGMYFGMNEVATRAWEQITKGSTFGAVLATLLAEFDVAEDILRSDLEKFVGALAEKQLVTVAA